MQAPTRRTALNYRVVIETRAIRDIEEATGWIAAQASDAVERWCNAIEAQINSLARFPERCPRAREDRLFKYELRQLVFGRQRGRYRVIFTIYEDAVHVLHVRHGATIDDEGRDRRSAASGLTRQVKRDGRYSAKGQTPAMTECMTVHDGRMTPDFNYTLEHSSGRASITLLSRSLKPSSLQRLCNLLGYTMESAFSRGT